MFRHSATTPRSPNSFKSNLAFAITLPAMLGLIFPAVQAQEPEVFGEVIDVRVVNLEVVVTEKGQRVTGLGPDDFELSVDKEPVAIEYFTEVSGGTAVASNDAGESEALPALAPGEPVGTSYLVFIDDFFTLARDRDRVLDALAEQLPNLQSQDRMAVVAYDGRRVDMLTNWTDNIPLLTRELRKAKDRRARGLERYSERRVFDTGRELEAGVNRGETYLGSNTNFDAEQEQMALKISGQVENAVRAATATLRGFANPPGRKVMLLLSGGWPADPLRWVASEEAGFFDNRGIPRGEDLLGSLSKTANRLSYTIYPVDMPGVTYQAVDAARGNVQEAGLAQESSRVREQEEEASLLQLARDTGGEAFLNGVRTSAFERAVADTRTYYWIGFTPTWQGNDSEHSVEIKVKRKGLKVRARDSFSDLSRSTEVSMMVESALLFGNAPGATPLEIEVGRGKRSGIGKRDVPLTIQVPLHELTFLPSTDGFASEVELRIAVLDSDGNSAEEIPVIPFGYKSPRAPVPGETTFIPFETLLRMRNKPHTLVVSIYDVPSGKILTGRMEVQKR